MALKKIPTVVQLPGGITLRGLPFSIEAYYPDGRPAMFRLLPQDTPMEEVDCVLFGHEHTMRRPEKTKIPEPQILPVGDGTV